VQRLRVDAELVGESSFNGCRSQVARIFSGPKRGHDYETVATAAAGE